MFCSVFSVEGTKEYSNYFVRYSIQIIMFLICFLKLKNLVFNSRSVTTGIPREAQRPGMVDVLTAREIKTESAEGYSQWLILCLLFLQPSYFQCSEQHLQQVGSACLHTALQHRLNTVPGSYRTLQPLLPYYACRACVFSSQYHLDRDWNAFGKLHKGNKSRTLDSTVDPSA